MKKNFAKFFRVAFLIVFVFSILPFQSASAAPGDLTIEPNAWNIIGLDSNDPATGPFRFPIGAKVCNITGSDINNVDVKFYFDTGTIDATDAYAGDAYINLRTGSLQTITIPTIAANDCEDAFFEVEVLQNASAFDKTREYHIVVEEGTAEEASTPQPRELYIEHLISQNRNSVTDVELDDVSVAAGGTMTLMVGNTYKIDLEGGTATQGYNQFEDFINFPNTIFQILSVETTYSADSNVPPLASPYPYLYADSCGWDNDPNSPTYRSCIVSDEKAGGSNVTTTYMIKIISGAGTTQTLNTLLYDFSGSSYHYNADFSLGTRYVAIVGPDSVDITKSFSPKAIAPAGSSVMTITLTNSLPSAVSGANFVDTFPAGLTLFNTTTTNSCGGTLTNDTFGALTAGDPGIALSGGTIAANGTCTITVNVTAALANEYYNLTDNLFIDVDGTNTDTGNNDDDTLKAASAGACIPGQTLVSWIMPSGASAPPDTAGGFPTTNNTGFTATSFHFPVAKQTAVSGSSSPDTTSDDASWETWGYKDDGGYVEFVFDTRNYTNVQMSFMFYPDGNGPDTVTVTYVGNGSGTAATYTEGVVTLTPNAWNTKAIDLSSFASTTGTTTIRITGTGATNDNQGADAYFNNVTFTGCADPVPAPTISKSFGTDPIVVGDTSTLTFTISNTAAGSQALTGVAFTDVLPAGLEINTPNGLGGTCTGTKTAVAGTDTISLSGASLAAGASCTVIVDILGIASGEYNNVTDFLSSTETGTTTSYAEDPITVWAPPVISKSFSPTSIFTTETSILTFTITNPNTFDPLTGVGFTDDLSALGLQIATPSGLTIPTGCNGGTPVANDGDTTISFSGALVNNGTPCTFSVEVVGITPGTWDNQTTNVTSTEAGNGNTASASIIVQDRNPEISLTKQISSVSDSGPWSNFVSVNTNSNVWYRFIVYNSGDVTLTGINVTDPDVNTASCTSLSLVAGDTFYCVVGPITTNAVAGTYPNTAQSHGTYNSVEYDSPDSTATYANPGLTITKSATETYFINDTDILHYSYVVENTGFAPILGPVTVTDDKVGSVSCQDVSAVGDFDNYLDVGESVNCPDGTTADYDVQPGDVTALEVTNQAYATASGVQSNTDAVTVPLAPDLSVLKTNDTSDTILVNNNFDWTLTVSNTGGTATFTNGQTLLTDNLPTSGATYSLSSSTATNSAGTTGTIDCSIVDNVTTFVLACTANGPVTIPNAESFSIDVTVTPTAVGSLVNPDAAGVCRADPGNVIVELDDNNNNCSNTVTVSGAPNLGLTKSNGVTSVTPGGTTTYSLTVTNNGTASTSGTITVVDVLPTGLSIADGAVTEGGANAADWTCTSASNVVTCTNSTAITTLSPSVFNFTVNVAANATGPLLNKAQVGGGGDPSNPNPPTSTTAGQCTAIDAPNEGCATDSDGVLSPPSISKNFAPDPIAVSGVSTLTFTISNANTGTALTGIAFTDSFPAGLQVAGTPNASTTGCGSPTFAPAAGNTSLSLSGGTIVASGTCTVSVDVTATSAGVKNNTSGNVISTNGGTGNVANDTLTVVSPPSISKNFSPDPIFVNGTSTLTFTITNSNTSTALTGVAFTDSFPSGIQIAGTPNASTSGCGSPTFSPAAGNTSLSLSGGSIVASGTCTVSVDVTATTSGLKNNTSGNVSSTNGGTGNTANDTLTVNAMVDVSLIKDVNDATPNISDVVTFTLTLSNAGPSSATNVVVTDVVPSGYTYVAASISSNAGATGATITPNDSSPAGTGLTWSVNQLDGLESVTLTYQATVLASGTYDNYVQVTAHDQTDSDSTQNNGQQSPDEDDDDTQTVTPNAVADLSLAKSVNDPSPNVGDTVTYTLTLTNSGPSTATNVEVTDVVPASLTYVALSIGSNAGATGATITPDDTGDPTLVWDVDALDNGESVTLTYQATVSQAGTITNTAEVTDSDQSDPDSSLGNCGQAVEDDCDSETIGGLFDPPTALKTFDEAGLPQLEFRMVWINSGNAFAIDTQVTDNIPTGTTYVPLSITCTPQGASTTAAGASAPLNTVGVVPTSSCGYDPATNRIQWQGMIGPDNGNLTEAAAANEVVITFRVTVDDAVNQVQNQGFSRTDVNADQLFDEGVLGTSDVFSNQVIWNRSGLPAPVADPAEKLPKALPATGFAPNVITDMPQQPADKTYAATDVWLEIPNLGVNVAIVGVPLINEKWDLSWLDNQVGWLEGTAFPSWQGNSAVTGHVTLPNGKSGPFASLGNLEWGDTVIVHAYGYVYVYQVRENKTIAPNNTSVLKHEEKAWLTLITCKNYNEDKDLYSNRVAVRAILISVTKEAATTPSDRER